MSRQVIKQRIDDLLDAHESELSELYQSLGIERTSQTDRIITRIAQQLRTRQQWKTDRQLFDQAP